jgi:hypothetical protein
MMARVRKRREPRIKKIKDVEPKEKKSKLVKIEKPKKLVVNWKKESEDSAQLRLGIIIVYVYKDEIETDKTGRKQYRYRYLSRRSDRTWVSLKTAMVNAERDLLERFKKAVQILEDRLEEDVINEEFDELFGEMEFNLTLLGM